MSYEAVFRQTVSEAAKLGVNVFLQLFTLTSKPPFTTQWQECGQAVKLKACRFHLGQRWWRKIQSLGLSRQHGKKEWGKSILEDSIRTVAFTTDGSQRLLCVGLHTQFSERQASGTVLRLPARKFCWRRLHFSSTCLVRMFCIIIEDHKRTWVIPCPFQCAILQCASQYFCSCICTPKNIKMRSVTTGRLKKSATVKKKTSSPQKLDTMGLTWFPESNLFHRCRINFYQTHACSSLLLAFTMTPLL